MLVVVVVEDGLVTAVEVEVIIVQVKEDDIFL